MAKSTKYTSKVPALAEYKAPWIKGEGDEREVDIDAALKAFHTLMTDKAKAQDAREDALAEVAERTTERDELQAKVDDKNAPDAQVEIQKANKRADDAEAKAKAAQARADRLEVAAEKGLTPAQAKRLQGETKEELEADADELLEAWGPAKSSEEGDEGDEGDDEAGLGTTPVVKRGLVNPGDPTNGSNQEYDYDAIAAKITGGGVRL